MKNEKNKPEISEKEIATLIATNDATDAAIVREAAANNAERARKAKIVQFEAGLANVDANIASVLASLRSLRKQEQDTRAKLASLTNGRAHLLETGEGRKFADALYPTDKYNADSYLANTLRLTK